MQTKESLPKIAAIGFFAAFAYALSMAGEIVPPKPPTPRVSSELSICVFCGASDKVDQKYFTAATQIGEQLARRNWTLVYGGGKAGLMGAMARAAKGVGGRVVGVNPAFIRVFEKDYGAEDELLTVTTMQERKTILQVRSDVFVILPGGSGTLDELADTLELRHLNQLNKPIIILNQDGYYDSLLAFFDRAIADKFSNDTLRQKLLVANNVTELFSMLERLDIPRRVQLPE